MLPRLDIKERKIIMKTFKNRDNMLFSDRLLVDVIFQDYCYNTNAEYCVTNFISWLKADKFGKEVLDKLANCPLSMKTGDEQ